MYSLSLSKIEAVDLPRVWDTSARSFKLCSSFVRFCEDESGDVCANTEVQKLRCSPCWSDTLELSVRSHRSIVRVQLFHVDCDDDDQNDSWDSWDSDDESKSKAKSKAKTNGGDGVSLVHADNSNPRLIGHALIYLEDVLTWQTESDDAVSLSMICSSGRTKARPPLTTNRWSLCANGSQTPARRPTMLSFRVAVAPPDSVSLDAQRAAERALSTDRVHVRRFARALAPDADAMALCDLLNEEAAQWLNSLRQRADDESRCTLRVCSVNTSVLASRVEIIVAFQRSSNGAGGGATSSHVRHRSSASAAQKSAASNVSPTRRSSGRRRRKKSKSKPVNSTWSASNFAAASSSPSTSKKTTAKSADIDPEKPRNISLKDIFSF
jgi:hypothetical protein